MNADFEAALDAAARLVFEFEGDADFRTKIISVADARNALAVTWSHVLSRGQARRYARVLDGEARTAGVTVPLRHVWRGEALLPRLGSVPLIMAELLEPGDGRVELADAWRAYVRLCAARGEKPLDAERFAAQLRLVCRDAGIRIAGDPATGRAWLRGTRLSAPR